MSFLFSSENDHEILCNMFNDKRTFNQQVADYWDNVYDHDWDNVYDQKGVDTP